MPDTRASNPTISGPSLLDKSTAKPGSVDMAIFEKNQAQSGSASAGGSQKSQGAVSSNYLEDCRRDNQPPPANPKKQPTVVLTDCKITTPPDQMLVNHPFEMEVTVSATNGASPNPVIFRVFCQHGDSQPIDQSISIQGARCDANSKVIGKGTLLPPRAKLPYGSKAKYHVVAEHSQAIEKVASSQIEVELDRPPVPVAVWNLSDTYFVPNTSFIRPEAKERFVELKKLLEKHPDSALSVFGHSDSEPTTEEDNEHSGRRAYAVYCLLTKDIEGWRHLDRGPDGDVWEKDCAVIMREIICENPHILATNSDICKDYMNHLFSITLHKSKFTGYINDKETLWSCAGCGGVNKFYSNQSVSNNNGRVSIVFFLKREHGDGSIRLPCSKWNDSTLKCVERMNNSLKNTTLNNASSQLNQVDFGCDFYSPIIAIEDEPRRFKTQQSGNAVIILEAPDFLFNPNSAVLMPFSAQDIFSQSNSLIDKATTQLYSAKKT